MITIHIIGRFKIDFVKVTFQRRKLNGRWQYNLSFHNETMQYQTLLCDRFYLGRGDVWFSLIDAHSPKDCLNELAEGVTEILGVATLNPIGRTQVFPTIQSKLDHYEVSMTPKELDTIFPEGILFEAVFESLRNTFGEIPPSEARADTEGAWQPGSPEEQLGDMIETMFENAIFHHSVAREACARKLGMIF